MDSLIQGTAMIFGMGNPGNVSRETHVVELVTFWFSWAGILASILYAVRHGCFVQSAMLRIDACPHLVNLYSQNPSAYLTLEDDKLLYFGQKVDGVIPYGVVGSTIVINGDPICADSDFRFSWQNLKNFASAALTTCFLSASLTISGRI